AAARAHVGAGAPARPELAVRARRADERVRLVDAPVAVVVERVAARLVALPARGIVALPPARAPARRARAGAHAVRVAEEARRHEALVDRAVAVVVAPVAHLGAGEVAGVLAAVGLAPVEVVEAGGTARDAARAGHAGGRRVGERAHVAARAA